MREQLRVVGARRAATCRRSLVAIAVTVAVAPVAVGGATDVSRTASVGTFYVTHRECSGGSTLQTLWVTHAPPDTSTYAKYGVAGFSGLAQTDHTGYATTSFRISLAYPVDVSAWADVDHDGTIPDADDVQIGNTVHLSSCGDTGGQRDGAPPSISIAVPLPDSVYSVAEDVRAHFSCQDEPEGSGIASCTGAAADGAALDTATAGQHTFSVTATDNAGNTRTVSRPYTVEGPTPTPPPSPTPTPRPTVTPALTSTPLAPPVSPMPATPPTSIVTPSNSRLPMISAGLSFAFTAYPDRTIFSRLTVKNVPRGATVTAACKPRCMRRKLVKRNPSRVVSLRPLVRKPLRPGTLITIVVSRLDSVAAVKLLKTRSRKPPILISRCLPPGAADVRALPTRVEIGTSHATNPAYGSAHGARKQPYAANLRGAAAPATATHTACSAQNAQTARCSQRRPRGR